jgi:hypothetical protein
MHFTPVSAFTTHVDCFQVALLGSNRKDHSADHICG